MAVQQNKKTPSKRGMHRSHDFLTNPPLAIEPTTGEVHLRHHVSPNGFYRGRKVMPAKGESSLIASHTLETRRALTCAAFVYLAITFYCCLM